jgi:hypothetical protein
MTLALNWATNANYSTGPDLGTPTKVNPGSSANGFISGVIAAPQHVNYIFDLVGDELAKAVDGVNGGSYTLGSGLTFLGADVTFGSDVDFQASSAVSFGGPLDINANMDLDAAKAFTVHGTLALASGAHLTVAGTADVDLLGAMAVHAGGSIDLTSGGDINVTSADVNINSGAQIVLNGGSLIVGATGFVQANGGTITIEDANDLVISASAEGFRLTLTPAFHDLSGQWEKTTNASGTLGWVQSDVADDRSIWFALPVNPGDTVVDVYARVEAEDHPGGLPAFNDMPVLELLSVDIDGVIHVHATKTDNPGTEPDYDALHNIVLESGTTDTGTMPHLATFDPLYVRLRGETGANSVVGLCLRSISGNIIARSYRTDNMVY